MRKESPDKAPCCGDGKDSGVAGRLAFAATPAFGAMALYSGLVGGPNMICSMIPDASPLGGMTAMYVLMSIFHAGPWLALVSRWFSRTRLAPFHVALPQK
jgi:hypothetical protein